MSLRNYTVIDVNEDSRAAIAAACSNMDRGGHTNCYRCASADNYGAWCCWRCKRECEHETVVNGYIYRNDGSQMAYARCFDCGRMVKALPRGSTVHDVCLRDNRRLWAPSPCEHCGSDEGAQRHHWAPQAIFADAEDWPTGWLCRPCHTMWHDAMRRAGGVSLPVRVGEEGVA